MLVLTRKLREAIVIGDDVEVFVLAIDGNKVQLGIQASPDIPVDRLEIHRQKQAELARTVPLAETLSHEPTSTRSK